MRETGADMHTITLEKGLATFLDGLHGKNRSVATIRAYQTDISQFISFLHANNVSIQIPVVLPINSPAVTHKVATTQSARGQNSI